MIYFFILPRNAGSNPSEGKDVHLFNYTCMGMSYIKESTSCVCCVGSGHCDELITHSEESYRACVCGCGCV